MRCFWFLRGRVDIAEPQTVVPDGRLEFVFHLADPFSRIDGMRIAHRQDTILCAGQLTSPIVLRAEGTVDVVGIRFRTAGASAIMRTPLSDVTDRVEPLRSLEPALAGALYASAARHTHPADRANALSRTLHRFVRHEGDALVAQTVRALGAVQPIHVRALARQLRTTERTIERRVQERVGLSPIMLKRVLRFRRAFQWLDRAPRGDWTGIAANAGYFDQAHLIRDFRQFAGAPPGTFFGTGPELARAFIGADSDAQ